MATMRTLRTAVLLFSCAVTFAAEELPSENSDGGCPESAVWLATAFQRNLGILSAKGLAGLFAPGGVVVTDKGKQGAERYFERYLADLSESSVTEEGLFCEHEGYGGKVPSMTAVVTHRFKKNPHTSHKADLDYYPQTFHKNEHLAKTSHDGDYFTETFLVHFHFDKDKHPVFSFHEPLLLKRVDLYYNDFAGTLDAALPALKHDAGVRKDDEGCSQEEVDIVRGVFDALMMLDKGSLLELFTPDAQVLSLDGLVLAKDYFESLLSGLKEGSVAERGMFCELDARHPSITASFKFAFTKKTETKALDNKDAHGLHNHGSHGLLQLAEEGGQGVAQQDAIEGHGWDKDLSGVLFGQFFFERRRKHGPLQLRLVALFSNEEIRPKRHVMDNLYMESRGGEHCSTEKQRLLRQYLIALDDCNAEMLPDILAPGAMLFLETGESYDALERLSLFLEGIARKTIKALGMFCEAKPDDFPDMGLHYTNVFKAKTGEEFARNIFVHFGFARKKKGAPLQIASLEEYQGVMAETFAKGNMLPGGDMYLAPYDCDTGAGCSNTAFHTVAAFFDALEAKDLSSALALVSPKATLLSPSSGIVKLQSYVKRLIEKGISVSMETHTMYCELYKASILTVRGMLCMGKVCDQEIVEFGFQRTGYGKHEGLEIQSVEILRSKQQKVVSLAKHSDNKGDGMCGNDLHDLVDRYLHAFASKDVPALRRIFIPQGTVASKGAGMSSKGDLEPSRFYNGYLRVLDGLSVRKKEVICVPNTKGPPSVAVKFMVSYKLGFFKRHEMFVHTLSPVRLQTYLKLQVDRVLMEVARGGGHGREKDDGGEKQHHWSLSP